MLAYEINYTKFTYANYIKLHRVFTCIARAYEFLIFLFLTNSIRDNKFLLSPYHHRSYIDYVVTELELVSLEPHTFVVLPCSYYRLEKMNSRSP